MTSDHCQTSQNRQQLAGVDHDGCFVDLAKCRIGQNLGCQLVHLGDKVPAQYQRQAGDGACTEGKCRPPCQGVADGRAHGGGERDFVIGHVESTDEPRIDRIVMFESQQGY